MSAQSPNSTYDLIKIQPRHEIKNDIYNNRGRIEKLPHVSDDDNNNEIRINKRAKFEKFLSNINTTIKDHILPVVTDTKASASITEASYAIVTDNISIITTDLPTIDETILASDTLILSDLLAINLESLKNGEVIELPNDISVSLKDGLLQFSFEGELLPTPPLSLEKFETVALTFKNTLLLNNAELIDDTTPNDVVFSPFVIFNTLEQFKLRANDTITQSAPEFLIKKVVDVIKNIDVLSNTVQQKTSLSFDPLLTKFTDVIHDNKAISLGSIGFIKQTSNNQISVSVAGQSLGASGVQNINIEAQNNVIKNSNARLEQVTSANNSLYATENLIEDGETLTQFLNNNNLRVVKDGHLQATQVLSPSQVNIVLSKMANGTQFKRLSVRLDPPELGRVDIKLSSRTADNSLKAHIIVERPEALTLLRRDIHQLEKMLAQSGLTLDENSISFELASDDGRGDSQTQEALKDLWRERNENGLHKNLASNLQSQDSDHLVLTKQDDEFYQRDDALNIRV